MDKESNKPHGIGGIINLNGIIGEGIFNYGKMSNTFVWYHHKFIKACLRNDERYSFNVSQLEKGIEHEQWRPLHLK